jgi:hypothetical protein
VEAKAKVRRRGELCFQTRIWTQAERNGGCFQFVSKRMRGSVTAEIAKSYGLCPRFRGDWGNEKVLDLHAIFGEEPVATVVPPPATMPADLYTGAASADPADDLGAVAGNEALDALVASESEPVQFDTWVQRPDVHGRLGWEQPELLEADRWWARGDFEDLPEADWACATCGGFLWWEDGFGGRHCSACDPPITTWLMLAMADRLRGLPIKRR